MRVRSDVERDVVNSETEMNHAPEEHLLEHGHRGHDARLPARAERVHLDVACDQGRCELCVRGGSCATTTNGLRDVVDLPCARVSKR